MTDKPPVIADPDEPDQLDFRETLATFVAESHHDLERQVSRELPPHAASDLLQDAYASLLARPPQLGKIRNFRLFFFGVMRHSIRDWIGQQQRQRHMKSALMHMALEGEPMHVPSAEACVSMTQEMETQLALLGDEAPQALLAFELVRVRGFKVQQVAERMGLSRQKTSRLICRVLLHLKKNF